MSHPEALKGLNCPRCGGMLPVPEGQAIVICPFCELRSVVRGKNGVRRYQVPMRINQAQAEESFRKFLSGNMAIAPTTRREAMLTESFIVHLPFWATWGRALGWIFGNKRVGSGDHQRWEPQEVKVVQEMAWNTAACEVGEFGVTQVSLEGRPLEPFAADLLHRSGMVFEPTGSAQEAQEQARQQFESAVSRKADIDRVSQTFVRIVRLRRGLVYYPLWVMRYNFRGRTFQVVIDGFSGEVLYGKAPGNVLYRAAILVGGMAVGSFLSVDVAWFIAITSRHDDSSGGLAIAVLVAGLAAMFFSYRTYRYGEHYEYRKRYAELEGSAWSSVIPDSFRQVGDILKQSESSR
jgi:hypothetical protein